MPKHEVVEKFLDDDPVLKRWCEGHRVAGTCAHAAQVLRQNRRDQIEKYNRERAAATVEAATDEFEMVFGRWIQPIRSAVPEILLTTRASRADVSCPPAGPSKVNVADVRCDAQSSSRPDAPSSPIRKKRRSNNSDDLNRAYEELFKLAARCNEAIRQTDPEARELLKSLGIKAREIPLLFNRLPEKFRYNRGNPGKSCKKTDE
jgi:hypothetical protein